MAQQYETTLDVGGIFNPDTKVEAHPRVADTLDGEPITKAATSAKVRQDGSVVFKGLAPHGPYFAVGKGTRAVIEPGAAGGQRVEEVTRSVRFDAAGPLAHEDDRNSQAQAALVASQQARARERMVAEAPSGAGQTSTGRQFDRTGAITTGTTGTTAKQAAGQVGAENRPGEATAEASRSDSSARVTKRTVGDARQGVEDRPKEAARRTKTQRKNPDAARVKSSAKSRTAGKPLSLGKPSR